MLFRIINAWYTPKSWPKKEKLIVWFSGVTEKNKKLTIGITGTYPRFWVDENPEDLIKNYKNIKIEKAGKNPEGKNLWMIKYSHPKQTYQLRKLFKKTYQADIPYIEAVRIFYKIPNIIEIPDDKLIFDVNEIKTPKDVKKFDISPNIFIFDIETGDKKKFPEPENPIEPIRSITFQRLSDGKIWHFTTTKISPEKVHKNLMSSKWLSENIRTKKIVEGISKRLIKIFYCNSNTEEINREIKLFEWVNSFLERHDVVILTAHYSDFDYEYLSNRLKLIQLKFKKKIPNIDFSKFQVIDYMKMFAKQEQTMAAVTGRIALEWMAKKSLGYGKIIRGKIDDMFYNDPERLSCYNIWDCELIYRVEKKRNLFGFYIETIDQCNTYLNNVFSAMKLAETDIMFRSNPNIIWPSRDDIVSEPIKIGGRVLEAPKGIFENEFEFDNSKEYPNIIISLNLDHLSKCRCFCDSCKNAKSCHQNLPFGKECKNYKIGDVSVLPSGRMYRMDVKGFIPETLKELSKFRDKIRKKMFEEKELNGETDVFLDLQNKEKVVKSVRMNGLYGQLSSDKNAKSRLRDGDIGTDITMMAGIHNTWNKAFLEEIKIYIKDNKITGYTFPIPEFDCKYLYEKIPNWIFEGMEKRREMDNVKKGKDGETERSRFDKKYYDFIEEFFKKSFERGKLFKKGVRKGEIFKLKVIYGDTDSNKCIFEKGDVKTLSEDTIYKLVGNNNKKGLIPKILNNSFKYFMELFYSEKNKTFYLDTKLEKWCDVYYQWGSKKRYAEVEHLSKDKIKKGQKPKVTYKGIDIRRRSTSKFCKDTQKGFFELLLLERATEKELRKFIAYRIEKLKKGEFDLYCGKSIGVNSVTKNKNLTQQWAAAKWSNEYLEKNFQKGDVVVLFPVRYVKDKPTPERKVVALEWGDNPKDYGLILDYEEIIRRDIKNTFDYIVRGLGYNNFDDFMRGIKSENKFDW